MCYHMYASTIKHKNIKMKNAWDQNPWKHKYLNELVEDKKWKMLVPLKMVEEFKYHYDIFISLNIL